MWIAFKTNSFPLRKSSWSGEWPVGQDRLVVLQSFVYSHNNAKPSNVYDANQMCIDGLVGDRLICAKRCCYLFDKTTSLCIGKYILDNGQSNEIDTIYEVSFNIDPSDGLRSIVDPDPDPKPEPEPPNLSKLNVLLTFNYVSKNTHKISDYNMYRSPFLFTIKRSPTINFDNANDAFIIMTVGTEELPDVDIGTSYDYFLQHYGILKP